MEGHDPFPSFTTLKLGQVGEYFGVSSHVVGKWLKDAGLRLPNGEPTQAVRNAGIAELVVLDSGIHPFWAWHKEKTIRLLEDAGHRRIKSSVPPPQPEKPVGPFTSRPSGGDQFEFLDANGLTSIWCRGERLANLLVEVLNLCHRCGKFS